MSATSKPAELNQCGMVLPTSCFFTCFPPAIRCFSPVLSPVIPRRLGSFPPCGEIVESAEAVENRENRANKLMDKGIITLNQCFVRTQTTIDRARHRPAKPHPGLDMVKPPR
jgi:hypothetical protein